MRRGAETAATACGTLDGPRQGVGGCGAGLVGAINAVSAALLYAIGWDRALSYDASRTVGQFVTAESLGGVFGQDRFNNHSLFSFLEYLVHSSTGSADERLLRVVPIACGALAVGLVAAAVARRFGCLAGYVTGATLAVNAMAGRQFREVRGYSLVALAAVVATLALFKRLRNPTMGATATYIVAMAVAVGTHLFAFGLLAVHALVVVGTRPRRVRAWLAPWAAVLGAGLIVQWPAIVDGLRTPPQYAFAPTFPVRLGANLLGGPALPGMLVLVVAGWTVLRWRPWVLWAVVGTAAVVSATWLAGPSWLDSRFFIWLAPATAAAAGVGVARRPRLVYVAVACVAVQLFAFTRGATRSEVPNRIAAGFVRASQQQGTPVCALGRTRAGLLAYVDDVPVLWDFTRLHGCDVSVEAAGPKPQPLMAAACERFAYVLTLPAKHPGAVFADQPLPLVAGFLDEAPPNAGEWEPTTDAALCASPPVPKGLRTP